MAWLWENAVTIANLVMAVAAIAALIYAHLQSSEGRRAAREANAHELWRDYLRLAFDHPKLADPSLHLADFDYDDLTIDGSAELFQKYEWFIGAMLDACVEILDFHADQGMARDIAQPASAPPRLSAFGAFPELGI